MKRILSILAFISFLLLPARASEKVNFLVVSLADGTYANFALAEKPTVGYAANTLHITATEQTVDINVADVQKFEFRSEPATAVDHLRLNGGTADGKACFTNLKPGTKVSVVTANGQQVASEKADENGIAAVDLSVLPAGVYIVSTPTTSIKISVNNKSTK